MAEKSKFKIAPNISITKGSLDPVPGVSVDTENRYYGVGGEYNIIDEEDTNLKLTGNIGKGSGRADVEHPGGKSTFKGEGSSEWNIGLKFKKKFSRGGGVSIQGTKFTGVK